MLSIARGEGVILKLLKSRQFRARLELIAYKKELAVRKVWKSGCERYFERELFVYQKLSKKNSMIPNLLAMGNNWLMIPYYNDIMGNDEAVKKKILSHNIKQIRAFLKFLYNEGYAHMDFHPGNLLYCEEAGLKVVDFEFLHKYRIKPESFQDSFDLMRRLQNFSGDLPRGRPTYSVLWKRACGYSLEEIASASF
jgi:RIO-like serine/threonine protein kinase